MSLNRPETPAATTLAQPHIFGKGEPAGAPHGEGAREGDARWYLLREVVSKTCSASDMSEVVCDVMHLTRTTLGAAVASLLLVDEEKQQLLFHYADGPTEGAIKHLTLGAEAGIAGWVALHGRPQIVNDAAKDERFCRDIDEVTGFDTQSIMCAPMVVCSKVIGVIEVINKLDGSGFTEDDLEALVAVAATTATAIELKRAEEERIRLEEQLQAAERSPEVTELVAAIAQGLSSPLAAIQGIARALTHRDNLDGRTKLDVQTLYDQVQRVSEIVDGLLPIAYRHTLRKRPASINSVVEKSLEVHAHSVKDSNIEVATQLDRDVPRTMIDPHQMQQVFVSIMAHAEQAMAEAHRNGKLVVKTEKAGEAIRVTFSGDRSGAGEDNPNRVCEPFFTTGDGARGHGPGLGVSSGIVQEHGGRLYAASKPGHGLAFVVELPILSAQQ